MAKCALFRNCVRTHFGAFLVPLLSTRWGVRSTVTELTERMRDFEFQLLFLTLSALVIFSNGKTKSSTSKLSLGSLSSLDLDSARFDGDILFDLAWPGSEAKEAALQVQL